MTEIELDRGQLPLPPQGVEQLEVDFGAVECAAALVATAVLLSGSRMPGDASTVILPGLVLLALLGGHSASAGQTYVLSWVGQRVLATLRAELFRHLQRMSLHFYTATRSGEIVSRINPTLPRIIR